MTDRLHPEFGCRMVQYQSLNIPLLRSTNDATATHWGGSTCWTVDSEAAVYQQEDVCNDHCLVTVKQPPTRLFYHTIWFPFTKSSQHAQVSLAMDSVDGTAVTKLQFFISSGWCVWSHDDRGWLFVFNLPHTVVASCSAWSTGPIGQALQGSWLIWTVCPSMMQNPILSPLHVVLLGVSDYA